MVTRKIRNYEIKATSYAELDKIEGFMNDEKVNDEEFKKYFHVWQEAGVGTFYFIKERYFVSRNEKTNYAISLLEYAANKKKLSEVA